MLSTVRNRHVFPRIHAELGSDCLGAGARRAVDGPDGESIDIDRTWCSPTASVAAVFIV